MTAIPCHVDRQIINTDKWEAVKGSEAALLHDIPLLFGIAKSFLHEASRLTTAPWKIIAK